MGMVSRNSECGNLVQAEERGLLAEAWRVVVGGSHGNGNGNYNVGEEMVIGWTVLGFVMGVFGVDVQGCWGKVCGECLGEQVEPRDSLKESDKKTTDLVTPTK